MIESLASLEKLVVQLRQKKTRGKQSLGKKAEKQLKDVRSTERRSSSGLHSIDKKIESEREDVSDVSTSSYSKNLSIRKHWTISSRS